MKKKKINFKKKNGIIYFSVKSTRANKEKWLDSLKKKSIELDDNMVFIIRTHLVPTRKVTELAILRGSVFSKHRTINIKKLKKGANEKGFRSTDVEKASLARSIITDEIMKKIGVKIIICIHEPLLTINLEVWRYLLSIIRINSRFTCHNGSVKMRWDSNQVGFLFDASKVKNFKRFLK